MKIYLISDNTDTVTGMRLAGIKGIVVHERDELIRTVGEISRDKEVGIIFITEKLSTEFPDTVQNIKLAGGRPLLLEIPDRHGSRKRSDFITAYISEAIGVRL